MTRCEVCGDPELPIGGEECVRCAAPGRREHPGRGEGEYVISIIGRVGSTVLAGHGLGYLAEYDPSPAMPPRPFVRITEDPAEALHFTDTMAARREWMRWDGNIRPDGKPSRPLTAFSIEISRG